MRIIPSSLPFSVLALALVLATLLAGIATSTASEPDGLAGRLVTGLDGWGPSYSCTPYLSWKNGWGSVPLSATDTITIEVAVIPFESGWTCSRLYGAVAGSSSAILFGFCLGDGATWLPSDGGGQLVEGPAYDPAEWNDIRIDIRPGSQDYVIRVNGQETGPLPLELTCPGKVPCTEVVGWGISGHDMPSEGQAWIDSLAVTLTSDQGSPETLLAASFDDGAEYLAHPGRVDSLPEPGSPGRDPGNLCAPAQDLLREIGASVTSTALQSVLGKSTLQKLRGVAGAMDGADLKASRVLGQVIAELEADRGTAISPAEADRLIELALEALEPAASGTYVASTGPAAHPTGLVGRLDTGIGSACQPQISWNQYWDPVQLLPTDTLTFEMVIIPFDSGLTYVGIDEENSMSFLNVVFEDGHVVFLDSQGGSEQGPPYDPGRWNDVRFDVRIESQDYILTVNGQETGPLPLPDPCVRIGGCYAVERFLVGSSNQRPPAETAWIDSVSLIRTPAGGSPDVLYKATFDDDASYAVDIGTLTPSHPPRNRPAMPGSCDLPQDLMAEIHVTLSAPAIRGAVRDSLLRKLRGTIEAMDVADLKAGRVLDQVILVLETGRRGVLTSSEAEALLAMTREARDLLSIP